MDIGNVPPVIDKDIFIALGIEGSANKVRSFSWYSHFIAVVIGNQCVDTHFV
jgi:hypothetical protein